MKLPHPDPTGFFTFLHQLAANTYGEPGTWGHGKACHPTRKGPGRRAPLKADRVHPAGTKLVRKTIRHGRGEQHAMRVHYAELTGKQYGAVEL